MTATIELRRKGSVKPIRFTTGRKSLKALGRLIEGERGLSKWPGVGEFAEQAAVSTGTVRRLEKGEYAWGPNTRSLARVCHVLKFDLAVIPR